MTKFGRLEASTVKMMRNPICRQRRVNSLLMLLRVGPVSILQLARQVAVVNICHLWTYHLRSGPCFFVQYLDYGGTLYRVVLHRTRLSWVV